MAFKDLFDGGIMHTQLTYHGNKAIKSVGHYLHANESKLKPNEIMFGVLHNEDGPAFQAYTTHGKLIREEYWRFDRHHREDGPAIILYTTSGRIRKVDWYYNGHCVTDLVRDWLKEHGFRWYRLTGEQKILFNLQMIEKFRKLYE